MIYNFEFYLYQYPFLQPLKTHHGSWEIREGIIIHLRDKKGNIGRGEIAPLPWFGSETLTQALEFCSQLKGEITSEEIERISDNLPACQFGFESALENLLYLSLTSPNPVRKLIPPTPLGKLISPTPLRKGENLIEVNQRRITYSYLLPTGETVLKQWQEIFAGISQPQVTFKWKIGVSDIGEEIKIFKQLIQELPAGVKLRLDANGGLSLQETKTWLSLLDKFENIEFLEQPLSPQQFDAMLALEKDYLTPLALDESVGNLKELERCYQQGWQGIFVIKSAIIGSPKRLRQFCKSYQIDAVFSSVFETKIGREAALNLANELSNPSRAIGFGVDYWFKEDKYKI